MSYKVKLEGLSFHAFHGVYEYERKVGNTFGVDVEVSFPLSRLPERDDLSLSPDYQVLNTVVQEEMKESRQLLETVARSITLRLWKCFPEAINIKIEIRKSNPPIGTVCHASCVVIETQSPLA